MLTLAIVDDEADSIKKMREGTERFLSENAPLPVQIKEFSDAHDFLSDIDAHGTPDIALLDICMPDVSGVQLAEYIRKKSDTAKIVFVTSSKEFAVEAFSVNAVHYLVKPFSYAQFAEAMTRIIQMFKTEPKKISINGAGESVTMVPVSDIIYIESVGRCRYVHTPAGEFAETRRTLAQFSQELEKISPKQFISPYRGYIVNLVAVRTITAKHILLKDGTKVLIKPGDFRALKKTLFEYTFVQGGGILDHGC